MFVSADVSQAKGRRESDRESLHDKYFWILEHPGTMQQSDRLIVLLVVRPSLTQCIAACTWLRPRSHPWQRTW